MDVRRILFLLYLFLFVPIGCGTNADVPADLLIILDANSIPRDDGLGVQNVQIQIDSPGASRGVRVENRRHQAVGLSSPDGSDLSLDTLLPWANASGQLCILTVHLGSSDLQIENSCFELGFEDHLVELAARRDHLVGP